MVVHLGQALCGPRALEQPCICLPQLETHSESMGYAIF